LDDVHGTVDNPDSCTATTSTLSEPLTTPADAGMTTDTPMVIAVMATAAIPKATRGLEGW
jgi:hypothetical protein